MATANLPNRRILLATAAGLLLAPAMARAKEKDEDKGKKPGQEKEVGAVEDLMREHGVLRRALLVYAESVPRIRRNAANLDAGALNQTARLFRNFGEDYHEKKLEEAYLFPAVKKSGSPAATYIDTLVAQHQRGREITEYIMSVTRTGKIGTAAAESLVKVLPAFVMMYQNHAAREDTIVFPAWKTALSKHQLDELGEKFEDIEKQQFGTDGYEEAVKQIGAIEQTLGLADIAQFTPPPPPSSTAS